MVTHAVTSILYSFDKVPALCGAKPGPSSKGWDLSTHASTIPNCKKCKEMLSGRLKCPYCGTHFRTVRKKLEHVVARHPETAIAQMQRKDDEI